MPVTYQEGSRLVTAVQCEPYVVNPCDLKVGDVYRDHMRGKHVVVCGEPVGPREKTMGRWVGVPILRHGDTMVSPGTEVTVVGHAESLKDLGELLEAMGKTH